MLGGGGAMTATNEHTGDKIKTGKGDQSKIADNWPWPDPFEERMKKNREEEAERKNTRNNL